VGSFDESSSFFGGYNGLGSKEKKFSFGADSVLSNINEAKSLLKKNYFEHK